MKTNIEDIKDFFGRVFVSDSNARMDLPSISKKVKGHVFEVQNWKITRFKIKRYNISHDVDHHFLTFVISGVSVTSQLEASLSNKLLGRSTLRLETQIRNMKYLVALQTMNEDIKKMHSKIELEFELLSHSAEKNKLKKGLLTLLNKLGINSLIQKTMQNRIDIIFSTQFIRFMKKNLNIGDAPIKNRRIKRPVVEMDEEEIARRIRVNKSSTFTDTNFKTKEPSSPSRGSKALGFLNISGSSKSDKKRMSSFHSNMRKKKNSPVSQRIKEKRRNTVIPKPSLPNLPNQKKNRSFSQKQSQEPIPPKNISQSFRALHPHPMNGGGVISGPTMTDLANEITLYKEIIDDKIMQHKELEKKLKMKELESLHFFLMAMRMMNKGKELSTAELLSIKENMEFFDVEEMSRVMKEMKAIKKI